MSKIAICTVAAYGTTPAFVTLTDKRKAEYCFRHDIDYQRSSVNAHPEEAPNWSKFQAVREALKAGAEWAVWMDADAAPMNDRKDLDELLGGMPQRMVIQRNSEGWDGAVFAMPNTERAFKMLDALDATYTLRRFRHARHTDHTAIAYYADTDFQDFIQEPPSDFGWCQTLNIYARGRELNEYQHHRSWCLHVPNKKDRLREAIFNEFLENDAR